MILVCPACSTRYLVDPSSLGSDGRMVRCAKCGHSWMQAPPTDLPPRPPDLTPRPDEIKPIPAGSNLPAPRQPAGTAERRRRSAPTAALAVVALLAVTGLGVAAWVGREAVTEVWPASARLYDALGVPVAVTGAGLELQNVRSERRVENGEAVLVIQGQISNISERERSVPGLKATALGPEGKRLAEWAIAPSHDQLLPGEIATFESNLPNPDQSISEIAITFEGD